MVIESDAPKMVENAAYTSYPGDPTAEAMADNAAYVSSTSEPEEGNVVPATAENVAATGMKIVATTTGIENVGATGMENVTATGTENVGATGMENVTATGMENVAAIGV